MQSSSGYGPPFGGASAGSYAEGYGDAHVYLFIQITMKDKIIGHARGFGFVVFKDPSVEDRVI